MAKLEVSVLLLVAALSTGYGQLIIPKRPLGYVYDKMSMDALIHMDAHMGPLCPDSQYAFSNIKAVADYYGNKMIRLTFHQFPLPYHRNSFLAAKGAHVFAALNPTKSTWDWFQAVYDNMDQFSNDNTANKTTEEVIRMYSVFAGEGRSAAFIAQMKSEDLETDTRAAWKYTCSRGIAGTPTFLLNDVIVEADPTWTLAEWKKVIDPLLHVLKNKACAKGTKRCEYLPGKVQCCTPGEGCIPNVGCRC